MPYKNKEDAKKYKHEWDKKHGVESARKRKLKHKIMINRIKSEIGCEHCGYNENPIVLQFHHTNPKNKLFSISKALYHNIVKVLKETEKCEVLCANCHTIEEYRLNDNSLY